MSTIVERFWSYTDKRGPNECWPWTGEKNWKGYGQLRVRGSKIAPTMAHRWAYEIEHHERVPQDMVVMHICDNPGCVNPAHLRVGTHADNIADRDNKNRQARGERHGLSRLTRDQVIAIFYDTRAQQDIADDYGIRSTKVSDIKRGRAWKHLGLCHECATASQVVEDTGRHLLHHRRDV